MALMFLSSVDSEARWKPQLARLMPELEVRIWPDVHDPADIDYALVWRPEPGVLASLPLMLGWLALGPVLAASLYTSYRDIYLKPR